MVQKYYTKFLTHPILKPKNITVTKEVCLIVVHLKVKITVDAIFEKNQNLLCLYHIHDLNVNYIWLSRWYSFLFFPQLYYSTFSFFTQVCVLNLPIVLKFTLIYFWKIAYLTASRLIFWFLTNNSWSCIFWEIATNTFCVDT